MTGSCSAGKIAAQTLFLGASVADFNVNMAWGGRPSQLSVKLVEDRSPCLITPYNGGDYVDDHYYLCGSDSECYIDENGNQYDPNRSPNSQPKPSKEKVVPGKVYYAWNGTKFVSKYWYNQDPGFFGDKTSITYNGNIGNYNDSKGYDLINTPAMFRIGDFSFTGLIQSYEKNYDNGGLTYNVTLESLDSILENCWIILDKHIGAVFGKLPSNSYGNPTNAIKGEGGIKYFGKISQGNIPNVFNIYGFLESMGIGDFGGSNRNDNGISAALIMDALAVLTSSIPGNSDFGSALDNKNKRAFSPFGRILLKIAQENETYQTIDTNFNGISFGVLPVSNDNVGETRCHVALDLSELPRPPLDYRIQEPSMSILSFIQQVTTATGADFYFETIPLSYNNLPYNIIKLKTITRSAQPNPKQISDTIGQFIQNGVQISSSRIGKEKNTNPSRVMYIGAPQQRLYQAKSYRLAFSQTQYIYHPVLNKFVEFYNNVAGSSAAGQFGKFRTPSAFSTRNTSIVSSVANRYATLFNIDEDIKNIVDGSKFGDADNTWADSGLSGNTRIGNYGKTNSLTKSVGEAATASRFFPLYKDVISPFFGYKHESNFEVNTTPGQNNVFRRIRPVWMDSWTGQLLVLMEVSELPQNLSVQLISRYVQANTPAGSGMFIVSESEIRAAANSFDSFITYCHGKIFGPDLFNMLKEAYNRNGLGTFAIDGVPKNNTQNNVAGQMGQPTEANPAPNALEIDYNLFFDQRFLRDLKILHEFVRKLSSYYGSKYLVKLPAIVAYKDQQYSNIQINPGLTTAGSSSSVVHIYKGSGKIFYNYEIANDGAWEEYGNIIDDSILVGSSDWYSVTDDNGKIKPILGYNSSQAVDYIGQAMLSGDVLSFVSDRPFDFYEITRAVKNIQKLGLDIKDFNNFKYDTIDVTQLQQDNFLIKNSIFNSIDAYGRALPFPAKKLYTTTSVEPDFAFLDPLNLRYPCAIVNAPTIPLTTTSKFFTKDPLNTVTAAASMEDLSIYLRAFDNPAIRSDNVLTNVLVRRITSVLTESKFVGFLSVDQSVDHHQLNPKVAHPYFAAIPVKSNQFSYGPWVNYPDLDRSIIFPDITSDGTSNPVENLIGNTRVEIKPEFAPWNYGGMSLLDSAVLGELYAEIQYQQIIETASINIPGLPIFGLGSSFTFNSISSNANGIIYNNTLYTPNTTTLNFVDKEINYPISSSLPTFGNPVYNPSLDTPQSNNTALNYNIIYLVSPQSSIAPIISNISCNISPQSIGTSYSFRTYTQKLGFFNKENSDRIKKAALDSFKINKTLADASRSFNTGFLKETTSAGRDLSQNQYTATKFVSGFYGTSPTNILVGMSLPYGYAPKATTIQIPNPNKPGKTIEITTWDIRHGQDPGDQEASTIFDNGQPARALLHDTRWATNVGSYTSKEAVTELGQNYKFKSAMSMDGVFSPISFYPEKFNTSFSLMKHIRKDCPECNGLGIIKDKVYDYISKVSSEIDFPCPYCSVKRKNIGSSATSSSKSKDALPPYIITNNNDINNILNFNIGSTDSSIRSGLDLPINMVTLQPIVVPYGEFKNNNTQDKDRCRHCITVIARGNIAPKNFSSYNIHTNLKTFYDPNTGKLSEIDGLGVNADYYPFDILANADAANGKNYPMNQRFFGLRGPLMLHAWGYDTNGYPVPNASDEPLIVDDYGRAARFNLIIEYGDKTTAYEKLNTGDLFSFQDRIYTKAVKNQVLQGKIWIDAYSNLEVKKITKFENDLTTVTNNTSYKNLGDIITKQYKKENGRWIKQPRSTQFALNWAERPDTWPVGPIDLRWDENRRVWTINPGSTTYKFVYITLEEDLVKEQDFDETYPAKGFLDDIEYSKDPLPQGYRRLVYVKDKTGYTAPKGVKLLCRYDSDSGFYEPISKPNVVATGLISNTSKAVINMDYAQGNRTITSPTLTVSYNNPLRLNVSNNKKAIFSYMNGQWTLTSVQP